MIYYVSYTKFLGLIVDHILSWSNHTDLLINKLSTAFWVLRCIKTCVSFTINNGSLISFPLNYDLRNYILGELLSKNVQDTKESN